MKPTTQSGTVVPPTRTTGGSLSSGRTGIVVPITITLVLVASALVLGSLFAVAMEVVPMTALSLLVGWVLSIGLIFALPLLVNRAVVAMLERKN